jgi:hypothetical protein
VGDVSSDLRARLVAGEVAALFGWISLAVVGHAHKIVPFIAWSGLRARGITTTPDGSPLLFHHLFDARVARATFVVATGAVVLLAVGVLATSSPTVFAAGCTFAVLGCVALANLGLGPRRITRAVTAAAASGREKELA